MAQFITGAGFAGTIGGAVTVYGTAERQTITVADVKGTVTFDPSFNRGGDTIVFTKPASSYAIAQSGSTVILTTNDNRVIVPVGTTAITLQFADGDRSLIYSGSFKLGDQIVNSTSASITALGSTKSALSLDTSTQAARLVLNQETVSVGGNVTVYGTSGSEAVTIAGGGQITFDPSFNKGGDTISLAKSASNYTAQRSGSSILLKGSDNTISIPVGTVGATVDFAGDRKTVVFREGEFRLGAEIAKIDMPITLSTSARTFAFQKISSSAISSQNISLFVEALAIADINSDGFKDIIISSTGPENIEWWQINKTKISSTDNRTAIFLNNGENQFSSLNTQNTNVTGWVNDWLVISQPNQKTPYIIGIDHGREFGEIENFDQWVSKLRVYQYNNGVLNELTDTIPSNKMDYYHNSSSYGDLNKDGYQDFVTAEMSRVSVFYGDPNEVFKEVSDTVFSKQQGVNQYGSESFIGSVGATLILDVGGDGQDDIVALPYVVNTARSDNIDYYNGDILKFSNGKYDQRFTFVAKTKDIADNYGYAYAKVADLNKDGLQDIVAIMEVNSGSKLKIISSMIQKPNNSFELNYLSQNGSKLIGSTVENYMLSIKFELFDIDGDGNLDLYVPLFQGTSNFKTAGVFFGDGNGNFFQDKAKADIVFKDVSWEGIARTSMADFNGDGLGDLLVLEENLKSNVSMITPIVFLNSGHFI